jgi:hypothetical protein
VSSVIQIVKFSQIRKRFCMGSEPLLLSKLLGVQLPKSSESLPAKRSSSSNSCHNDSVAVLASMGSPSITTTTTSSTLLSSTSWDAVRTRVRSFHTNASYSASSARDFVFDDRLNRLYFLSNIRLMRPSSSSPPSDHLSHTISPIPQTSRGSNIPNAWPDSTPSHIPSQQQQTHSYHRDHIHDHQQQSQHIFNENNHHNHGHHRHSTQSPQTNSRPQQRTQQLVGSKCMTIFSVTINHQVKNGVLGHQSIDQGVESVNMDVAGVSNSGMGDITVRFDQKGSLGISALT